jgi:predicted nucleic acid-binding protein
MALVVDTGPLLASLDRDDREYRVCRDLLERTSEPLILPAPILVEVDYWASQRLGPRAFLEVLDDIARGAYVVIDLDEPDYARVRELCDRYSDSDIGFVDAAVLAVVEKLGEPKLATLDQRHFRMLRPRHVDALELLPESRA